MRRTYSNRKNKTLSPSFEMERRKKGSYVCDYCSQTKSYKDDPPFNPPDQPILQICPSCVGHQRSLHVPALRRATLPPPPKLGPRNPLGRIPPPEVEEWAK